jgi:poly(hydroxyalkanoate) depolymerase family esterase
MIDKMQWSTGLREVMQLMRAGDLRGATAAIQRGLGGQDHPASVHPAPDASQPVIERPAVAPEPGEGAARFIGGTHASASGKRRYKLFIPGAYRGQPLPLLVMLHGCTQTPADFATGTRMNEVAAERGCFVVYPEQSRSANHARCWNWFNTGDQRRDAGEPGIIASLVRELIAKYAIDPSRIYVAGLSAGGAMAVILGRTHPELFAAVGVHSGLPFGAAHDMPSALAAMRSGPGSRAQQPGMAMPTIVFHGDRDTTVHPANGDKVAEQATGPCTCDVTEDNAGADSGARTFSRKRFKDSEGTVMVESWLIHGAAHKWSGGDPRGTHTDASGPDASREMMRFFLERSRH